jgi:uncharacterized membrane protein
MKGDAAMLKRLSALPILTFILLILPLQAVAQQPTQPAVPPQGYYGPGPWHQMWGDGYGWHFWWMFPLMMLCMIVFFAVIFFLARTLCGHGLCGHGGHHWGHRRECGVVTQATLRCRYSTSALREARSRRMSTRRRKLRSSPVDSISKRSLDRAVSEIQATGGYKV